MKEYLSLQEEVTLLGSDKTDRTGTGTRSRPGITRRYDIRHETVAAVTTKALHFKTGLVEEQWMMSGDTTLKFLKDNNCNIWDEWVKPGTGKYRPRTVKEMRRQYKRDHFGWKEPDLLQVDKETLGNNWEPVVNTDTFVIWKFSTPSTNPVHQHFVTETFNGSLDLNAWKDPNNDVWMDFYRALGISDQEVIDGELGKVYGAMFRNIPDVRLVTRGSPEEMELTPDRGFEFRGNVEHTGLAVYSRRIDQVKELIHTLSTNPDSRRHILCPWNPAYIDEQALPPCHSFIQFWTRELNVSERYEIYSKRTDRLQQEVLERAAENPECILSNMYTHVMKIPLSVWYSKGIGPEADAKLSKFLDSCNIPTRALTCLLYQRSADIFLGVPYNLTFYSILTHKLAHQLGMWGEELVHMIGDAHIYDNHKEQVALQQTRDVFRAPYLKIKVPVGTSILDYKWNDVEIKRYHPHPAIAAPIAV